MKDENKKSPVKKLSLTRESVRLLGVRTGVKTGLGVSATKTNTNTLLCSEPKTFTCRTIP